MTNDKKVIDREPLQLLIERYKDKSRDALLPFLQDAQEISGWLPEDVQISIAETLHIPVAEIHGVIEFYSMLYNKPTSKKVVRVCHDPVCHIAGAENVSNAIENYLNTPIESGEHNPVTIEQVSCLGMCEYAPAALIGEQPAGDLRPEVVGTVLSNGPSKKEPKIFGDNLLILDRVGNTDPGNLVDYERNHGYEALRFAVESSPSELIDLVLKTGILGRGGAMFPVGRKWLFTRDAGDPADERYIVVNGDESEPGVFKDRVIMEEDPFIIVEAATIAAYAIGATKGWIFVRGEYPICAQRLGRAIKQAREGGYLGRNILGINDFDFDIEIRRGAGAYICGEETALFEAIEGRRGFPRIKPPFPVTRGLFQKPTAVNNVETLAALVTAFRIGEDDWKSIGTEQSPGTKLFCLSGQIRYPGLYEMPFGVTIAEMIEKAGGTSSGAPVKAVLVGGAAGVFIGPDKLEMPLSYEDSKKYGVPLGSGALMVFDESADLRLVLYQISRFFAHESCGKCYPCQLGTQRQTEILERAVLDRSLSSADAIAIEDIGFAMTQTSLCGLGQTAASALTSAVERWPELYR